MQISVNASRLSAELEELAAFSEAAPPAVTRIVFSDADVQARQWLKERCRAAGLLVREAAIGNMFARWRASGSNSAAVATGSHIDAIPNAGRYDGTVGVLGGLEAIRALQESGFTPVRDIELILFTAEEPTRFGLGCLGSRLLSGVLHPSRASELQGFDGISLPRATHSAGFTGDLDTVPLAPGHYASFVELHIEQGPLLEKCGKPVGVVTSIAAPATLRCEIEGTGGHAGAVLMPDRRAALTGAAEIILAVEQLARASGAPDTVGTTGVCQVFPGAVNSIPLRVSLEIDIRDVELVRRDTVVESVSAHVAEVCRRRGLVHKLELVNADGPARCDPSVCESLRIACLAEKVDFIDMVSRAYHDSLFMSRIAPAAMLFIPCRGGISHRPDEFASVADIATGVRGLARTLAQLAAR